MQEIKCPKCGEMFQIDEAGYAQILQQVRDKEFEKELAKRQELINQQSENELKVIELEKEQEIEKLKAQLNNAETEKELAVNKALQEKEKELVKISGELMNKETEIQLKEKSLKEKYEQELKLKDEQIEQYKDFKLRMSTKMIGESLEQHCLNEFNKIRMTAFPNAYFEKDNDASAGSKGDFIYRETDNNGVEIISIMFEMKNEADSTETKHKNEDFFAKLDKDRNAKKCEYAVLVSMLESENELYNQGIVDVSYKFEKMYVIRPQFFIPMITLLRNAALNSLQYKQELQMIKNTQVDLQNFEDALMNAKNDFSANYNRAASDFEKAIDEIDKSITHLQKTKDELLKSGNQLRLANNKLMDVNIKKLTKNSPSIREIIEK